MMVQRVVHEGDSYLHADNLADAIEEHVGDGEWMMGVLLPLLRRSAFEASAKSDIRVLMALGPDGLSL